VAEAELDELAVFLRVLTEQTAGHNYLRVGSLHCPICGGTRKMDMNLRYRIPRISGQPPPPALATLQCGECGTIFTAVFYKGPSGASLAVLPSTRGGLTTPHTPVGVGYYLDQAQRAHSVGANSAAAAMFRGGLDHLLFDQGFKDGMCGKKLKDLEAAIAAGKAPKWAYELDTEFLQVMKELGDGSIHPNDGDVKKQEVLDAALIAKVRHTFEMLLFLIYEVPLKKQDRLDALKAAVIKK
jgi:hypothetical protein